MKHDCIARPPGGGRHGCYLPEDDDAAADEELEAEATDTRTFEERLEEGFALIGGMNAA